MHDFDLAVLLDAFEPYLLTHRAGIAQALSRAPRVRLLVGSARSARSLRHPWTAQERVEMIHKDLSPQDNARVEIRLLRDHLYDEAQWLREIQLACADANLHGGRVVQIMRPGQRAALPRWQEAPVMQAPDAKLMELRRAVFGPPAAAIELERIAPPSTLSCLARWQAQPWFAQLRSEYADIETFHESWKCAPYPPIFVTTDAVVLHRGHLLLIRRARAPGKGLWALPGGFIEPDEPLLHGCLREIYEETGLDLTPRMTSHCRVQATVFDAPHRSLRGRTITHAYRFDLHDDEQPAVAGGDDAGDARWIPLARVFEMEEEMFEDHFHIASKLLACG